MALTAIGKWKIFQSDELIDPFTGAVEYIPAVWGPLLGLHLIALGTGGIKPCVSSFGGDQFMASEVLRCMYDCNAILNVCFLISYIRNNK